MVPSPRSLAVLSAAGLLLERSAAAPLEVRGHKEAPTCKDNFSINWVECEAEYPEGLECGQLSVPIDWSEPQGEHFNLGLVRLPAPSNSTTKIGNLFMNPGGPGGSSSELVATVAMAPTLIGPLHDAFDVIGLDPRGVGLSNQVVCDDDIYNEHISIFPTTQDEYDALVDHNRRLGESCLEKTGPLIRHLDTISVARDHEAVRLALGDEPMNFLGESYGTQLGEQYAELFPGNIRTLALDGVLQHSLSEAANLVVEAMAYERGMAAFLNWASESPASDSALSGRNATAIWLDLISSADKEPIPAPGCEATDSGCYSTVRGEDMRITAANFMVFADMLENNPQPMANWGYLSQAVAEAYDSQNATLLSASTANSEMLSHQAIACSDWTSQIAAKGLENGVQELNMWVDPLTPLTRGATEMYVVQMGCIGWPVEPSNPPAKMAIDIEGGVKALMVSSEGDHTTAYGWMLGMEEEFVSDVAVVTRKGWGHTSFARGGDAAQLMALYLLTGEAESGVVSS